MGALIFGFIGRWSDTLGFSWKGQRQPARKWDSLLSTCPPVWLVHAPETIYVRVWEVLVLYMISSMDSVRRREIRSRLLGQEAKNSEWWKQRTIAIFKKHINNFVVMTDLVPCRWNVPILQTHPFISAGLGNEEGEVPPGRAKLEVRW